MKVKAKRGLRGLLFALLLMGAGALVYPAQTQAVETDNYAEVWCEKGPDGWRAVSCLGTGDYICCE